MKHYVITRYNTDLYNALSADQAKAWMLHRFSLFSNITAPSLSSQSNTDFKWFIIVDPKTPEEDFKLIESVVPGNAEVIRQSVGKVIFLNRIISAESQNGEKVLTTRIDNDDAVRSDYVDLVQSWAKTINDSVIDSSKRYFYDVNKQKLYLQDRRWFCYYKWLWRLRKIFNSPVDNVATAVETYPDIKTVLVDNHDKLQWNFKKFSSKKPLTMISYHGKNLSEQEFYKYKLTEVDKTDVFKEFSVKEVSMKDSSNKCI